MKNTQNIFSLFIFSVFLMLGSFVMSTVQVSAQDCDIVIEKIATPDDDTEFDFTVTGFINLDISLSDPSAPAFAIDLPIGTEVTIVEEVTPGWVLDDIECSDPAGVDITIIENGVTVECLTIDAATCNFINRMEAEPTNVPTLSEWGLISMAGILGIVGFMVTRRKKASA